MRRELAQLICAVAGLMLGLLLPRLSAGSQVDAGRVATMLFTIGFGVVSLVSIIYSLLFLVVQFSAPTFTPRLSLFRDEPIVWRAFAFAVGVLVFCITAGLAAGIRSKVSVAVPSAGMALTMVALALMWALQLKAFASIQLAHALTAITARAPVVRRPVRASVRSGPDRGPGHARRRSRPGSGGTVPNRWGDPLRPEVWPWPGRIPPG